MKQSADLKHITEKLFDLLQDVQVEIALQALARVTEEFSRAAKDEPELRKPHDTL